MIKAEEGVQFQLVQELIRRGWRITTVESCTGGSVASAIVDVPGASEVFEQGLVTYSNEAKHRLAAVSEDTLKAYGAVSRETAEEMCRGGSLAAGAEVAAATTGLAGPGGGTEEKPVGLVYTGVYCCGRIAVEKHIFAGNRSEIRAQAAEAVLDLALRMVRGV